MLHGALLQGTPPKPVPSASGALADLYLLPSGVDFELCFTSTPLVTQAYDMSGVLMSEVVFEMANSANNSIVLLVSIRHAQLRLEGMARLMDVSWMITRTWRKV